MDASATLGRPMRPPLLFVGGVALAFALALAAFYVLMRPSMRDIGVMALSLSFTAGLSIIVGHTAYSREWISRSTRLSWTLLAIYSLSSILTVLNVWVAAQLMFASEHDLILAMVLLFFAAGIAMMLAYFLSLWITGRIVKLRHAATEMAQGHLDARVAIGGRDEIAELACTFNEMAQELEDAARRRRELETLRRDLIAWVGHDLRTPLAAIRAIVEALADGVVEDPAAVHRYLDTAQHHIRSLSTLVDDLFELAQIDAGALQLDRHANSIRDLISDTLEAFSTVADHQGVTLEGSAEPDSDPVVMDIQKIGRVMTNLIDNALRHTPAGGTVRILASGTPEAVQVEVADNGEGIHPEDLQHIFDRFYRGEKSRSRATGGSGLGMAIAKGIVEAHGGHIRVESTVGQGTSVLLNLPRR
jgi:signal transduction histidine kinase